MLNDFMEEKARENSDRKITIHDLPTNHPIYKEIEERTSVIQNEIFENVEKGSVYGLCERIAKLEIILENHIRK